MADVQDTNAGAEPSMEEILASIRRIIADEKDPSEVQAPPASSDEDIVELTQIFEEPKAVEEAVKTEPEKTYVLPEATPSREERNREEDKGFQEPVEESLVSDDAAGAAVSSLSALAHTVEIERRATWTGSSSPLGNGSRTLEDMVVTLMKPLLKEWLDQNLPPIVDRAVQKEVERIARRVQE